MSKRKLSNPRHNKKREIETFVEVLYAERKLRESISKIGKYLKKKKKKKTFQKKRCRRQQRSFWYRKITKKKKKKKTQC